jgi:prephenate dehydratase
MKIAIQGERGSFSHEAVLTFLRRAEPLPCNRSAQVFDLLERKRVEAALLPLENSLAGSVAEHYDLLLTREGFIQREFRLRIRHNLIAPPGVKLSSVKRVLSHPVALDQCRKFFRAHPQIEAVPFYDTAGSVKHLMENSVCDAAAIAAEQAAREFGGKVLLKDLQDDKQNFTRFVLITRKPKPLPGANKTSVCFSLRNEAGALFKSLSVFALRDISLSKIESRPWKGRPWEYVFYVDYLRGDDEVARRALDHLREISDFVKVLGVYPAAK